MTDTTNDTQSNPNLSTEHRREGDARRPSDTLDRGQDDDTDVQGQENVEDRPNVGQVEPSDYPHQQ